MATAVLTNTPTVITLCESITGFTGDTFSLNTDFPIQGANDVSCAMTNNGVNDIRYATANSPGGQFSAVDIHIRMPANFAFVGDIDTDVNDGIQIAIIHGGGTSYYTVGGSTTYSGGWKQFVFYTGDTPTSGSVPSGTCTSIGFRVNTTAKPRNQPANAYFDAWYFGDGYTVTGGTSGDEIDWSHIAALDAAQAYKIVEKVEDIYMLAGNVTICNGATTTYFKSGQKVQFKDLPVSSTLYGVTFAGSAGNVEITGGAWGAAGAQNYLFDASDTALNSFDLSGVQFEKASSVLFSSTIGAKQQSITNSSFILCGEIDPSLSIFTGITITNTTDASGGLLYPNTDTHISNLKFISDGTGYALRLVEDGTGARSFDDLEFVGYGADDTSDAAVNYVGTSAFDLSFSGGTKPTVNPTSLVTVLENQVDLTFLGLINGKVLYVKRTDTDTVLIDAIVSGNTHTISIDDPAAIFPILIRHRISSPSDAVIYKRYTNTDAVSPGLGVRHTVNLNKDTLTS